MLVCAADHGHVAHGTSLFDADVSAQVAAAAARGETAAGVLARRGDHVLLVADVGLRGPTPDGVRDAKVAEGTADMLRGPGPDAPSRSRRRCAPARALAAELCADGVDCLVLGEIGIGNTTTTAALVCALTGAPPEQTVGRGTGLDAAGLERKREAVRKALERHNAQRPNAQAQRPRQRPTPAPKPDAQRAQRPTPNAQRPTPDALQSVGGLELAALAGAAAEAARRRVPVLLDGYATGAAALAATLRDPAVGEALIASPPVGRARPRARARAARARAASSTCACGSARPAAPCSRCR